jgi:hypothetical protein
MHERIIYLLRELHLDAAEDAAQLTTRPAEEQLAAAVALFWSYLDRRLEYDLPPALWAEGRLALLDAWPRVRARFVSKPPVSAVPLR